MFNMATNNAINAPIPFSLANGGTGAALTASNGAVPYSTSSAIAFLAATATANQMFVSGASSAPSWTTSTWPTTTTVNQLLYSSSNNTVAGLGAVNSASLATSAAGLPTWLGPLTNGQVIIGSTGAIPVASTLSGGTNVSIVNTAGSITITTAGTASFLWNSVVTSTVSMAVENGYICANGSTLITYTLPATANTGTSIKVAGNSAGGWIIEQNASQNIKYGNVSTTTGTGGSLASSNQYDQVDLLCVVGSTTWVVRGSIGNLTYV
jgi:hypothetical protein